MLDNKFNKLLFPVPEGPHNIRGIVPIRKKLRNYTKSESKTYLSDL